MELILVSLDFGILLVWYLVVAFIGLSYMLQFMLCCIALLFGLFELFPSVGSVCWLFLLLACWPWFLVAGSCALWVFFPFGKFVLWSCLYGSVFLVQS